MRLGEQPGAFGHGEQLAAARAKLFQLVGESLRRQRAIRDQERGAFAHEVLRVVSLVVVYRGREWNQDRADTNGGEFGDGERASTADHQISPSIRLGHVLDERSHIGAYARRGVTLTSRLDPTLARLVAHIERHRAGKFRQGERHDGVELGCSQAAADDENANDARCGSQSVAPGVAPR